MAKLLADDFREFLKLCNRRRVKYLLIGGYAVNYYGHSRTTADMDVWIEATPENAKRIVDVLTEFGFGSAELLSEQLFLEPGQIVRMGYPPVRLEILNEISGVYFAACYKARHRAKIDGIRVDLISLPDLKKNKAASARLKDLDDLEHLAGLGNGLR
ncbi:MAG: nucleotidyltransferase [Gemmataceae bacterium]